MSVQMKFCFYDTKIGFTISLISGDVVSYTLQYDLNQNSLPITYSSAIGGNGVKLWFDDETVPTTCFVEYGDEFHVFGTWLDNNSRTVGQGLALATPAYNVSSSNANPSESMHNIGSTDSYDNISAANSWYEVPYPASRYGELHSRQTAKSAYVCGFTEPDYPSVYLGEAGTRYNITSHNVLFRGFIGRDLITAFENQFSLETTSGAYHVMTKIIGSDTENGAYYECSASDCHFVQGSKKMDKMDRYSTGYVRAWPFSVAIFVEGVVYTNISPYRCFIPLLDNGLLAETEASGVVLFNTPWLYQDADFNSSKTNWALFYSGQYDGTPHDIIAFEATSLHPIYARHHTTTSRSIVYENLSELNGVVSCVTPVDSSVYSPLENEKVTGNEHIRTEYPRWVAYDAIVSDPVTDGVASNFEVSLFAHGSAVVTEKPGVQFNVYMSGDTKEYDGTTSANTLFAVDNVHCGSESLPSSAIMIDAHFDNKNAGDSDKNIFVTFSLSSDYIADYELGQADHIDGYKGKITKKSITVSGTTVADKVYDGTNSAEVTVGIVSGIIDGENVTVSAAGTFYNVDIGQDKEVAVVYTLGGADAGNYKAPVNDTLRASITPRPAIQLTVTGTEVDNKVYDGNTTATILQQGTLNGVEEGDDVLIASATGTFADKNVGENKAVTLAYTLGGSDAGNYTVAAGSTTANITAKEITANFTAASRDYNGGTSTTATFNGFAEGAVLSGDTVNVTVSSAAFGDKNVGTGKAVTVTFTTSGTGSSNYQVSAGMTTANITAKQLSISGTSVDDKPYDGTDTASITVGTLSGVVSGETVGVTASGAFPSSSVGTYDVTVSYTLTGAAASNYTAPASQTFSATINALSTPEITFEDVENVYTGSAQSIEVTGTLAGDTVLYSTDGTTYSIDVPEYTNVGEYRVYAKVQRANYNDWTGDAVLKITPKQLTVQGTTVVASKTYDGTTDCDVTVSENPFDDGVVGDDNVALEAVGSYEDKLVGVDKSVTVTYTLTGADADNYELSVGSYGTTANITSATISVGNIVVTKEYDGTAEFVGKNVIDAYRYGVVDGDDVSLNITGIENLDGGSDVGSYLVRVSFSLGGDDRDNYVLDSEYYETTATITEPTTIITEPDLQINGQSFLDTTITLLYVGYAYEIEVVGKESGDECEVIINGDPEGSCHYAGSYDIEAKIKRDGEVIRTLTGNVKITKAPLTITSPLTLEKEYDGTTETDTILVRSDNLSGLKGSDNVTCRPVFSLPSNFNCFVGTYNDVPVSFELVNSEHEGIVAAHNYYLQSVPSTATLKVNRRPLTIVAPDKINVLNKSYDETKKAKVIIADGAVSGILPQDEGMVSVYGIGEFDNADEGDDKPVTISFALSGLRASNYSLNPVSGYLASIKTPRLIYWVATNR